MNLNKDLRQLVDAAKAGNKNALEVVILEIKDLVYNLSLKMLLFPTDAEDATQEILVKVITSLSTFKGESQFTTWVYRIATNYLLTAKSNHAKMKTMSFEEYAKQIDKGQTAMVNYTQNEGELSLLEEEVKVSCTQGLLLCLKKEARMVYILAVILDFNSTEGAMILAISATNFRQQLSRARSKIRQFLQQKCGLANPNNPCRCHRKINFLVEEQLIDLQHLRYANFTNRSIDLIEKIDKLGRVAAIYRSVPIIKSPDTLIKKMQETIQLI